MQPVIHRTWGQGRWFPAGRDELAGAVDGFLEQAGPQTVARRLAGVIAPHAGYRYSGAVAGYAFRALRDGAVGEPPETVVILGFSHREAFPGMALLDGDGLASPLGTARLDSEAVGWLTQNNAILTRDDAPHQGEHSAENQVPFLQRALPGARLVLGLFGEHSAETVAAVAEALRALARRRRIVVVASTDLLHDPDYDRVTRTDRETVRDLAALDATALQRRWKPGFQVCCGLGPVQALLRYAHGMGVTAGTVLCTRNSGDDFPESRGQWVVGYAAIAYGAG